MSGRDNNKTTDIDFERKKKGINKMIVVVI